MRPMKRWGPVILIAMACGGAPQQMCMPRSSGGTFCVPDAGRLANLDVKLQIRDDCTSACDTGLVGCLVSFDGGTTIGLSISGQACFDPNTSCPAVCGLKTYVCPLPALPDGTYTVTSDGQGTQQVAVGPGGAASCSLP